MTYTRSDDFRRRISEVHKGVPKSETHRKAISESMRRSKENGGVPEHGTIARYRGARKRAGCHCEVCRKAWREYTRARKAAKAS